MCDVVKAKRQRVDDKSQTQVPALSLTSGQPADRSVGCQWSCGIATSTAAVATAAAAFVVPAYMESKLIKAMRTTSNYQ